MGKNLFLYLLFICALAFAETEKFDLLMGKETPAWQYVQTAEDQRRLSFFRTLFEREIDRIEDEEHAKSGIPKVIHWIWLGPEPFPKNSIARLEKWIALHPDWTFTFWTDLDRPPPHEKVQKRLVSDFSFQFLADAYNNCENVGEKAKMLAYEILLQEGGLYVDHDATCIKSFENFHAQFDFYCGLEKLAPSILSSSIIPSTHLIGAQPEHPVLQETILWLKSNWNLFEELYSGQSMVELKAKVMHRTFWALSEGIQRGIDQKENRDIVFPVSYFSGKERKASSYAVHDHEGKWANPYSQFESKLQKKLEEIIQKDTEAIFLILLLSGISFLGSFFLFLYARKIKRSRA